MEHDALNILISCESQSQMDPYISCFRELGHNVRGHRITSGQAMVQALEDPQWDLVIAVENHPEMTPMQALQTIHTQSPGTPCIVHLLGTENHSERDYLREGAVDVISTLDDERLSLSGMRAILSFRDQRELRELRVKYAETARRCELLLATSNDAIGYLVDGMHVDTNDAYAELFGYADKDELAAIPLVDLIAEQNQADFKAALKRYRSHPEDETSIQFTAMRQDGSEFGAQLVLSTARFEGEPCMQALIRPSANTSVQTASAVKVPAGGAGGIAALQVALNDHQSGQLILMRVDKFVEQITNIGIGNASRLPDQIGQFLQQKYRWNSKPIHATDDVLAVLVNQNDAEEALILARRCIEDVAGHILEIGEHSTRCSLCAIVVDMNTAAFDSTEALLDVCWSKLIALAHSSSALRGQDAARAQLLVGGTDGSDTTGGVELIDKAVREGALSISFQPIISLRGDANEYYEVTSNYRDAANDKSYSAQHWLELNHLADKTLPLDQFVIETALTKVAELISERPQTRLILPIGPGSLADEDFISWFNVQLQSSNIAAETVTLQVPYKVARNWLKQCAQLSQQLQQLGSGLSISGVNGADNPMDDLMHLKPQFVRIDEALVSTLEQYDQTNAQLKPLIDALHQDQMLSIMPGVSAAGALAVLWQLGVAYIQGDYLQGPTSEMNYDFTDLT